MADDREGRSILGRLFECVNSGLARNTEQKKSACPPKKKKSLISPKESKSHVDKLPDAGIRTEDSCPPSWCPETPPYTPPSQVCPKQEPPCCYIKKQDPCRACCCETLPQFPPCPPKCYSQEPRQPTCGCDLCKKNFANSKCCDKANAFHGTRVDPRLFEA